MTVRELEHRMTIQELNDWFRYYNKLNEQPEKPEPPEANMAFFMEAFK